MTKPCTALGLEHKCGNLEKGDQKAEKTVHHMPKGVTAALQLYPHRRQCQMIDNLSV